MPEAIGVLGSLCNPPHRGHAALARAAATQLGLDRVLLVPTGVPPHRDPPAESAALRLRLAEAAAADEAILEASDIETARPGRSYMADTLELLAPRGALVLLLGADQFAALDAWHAPERIRAAARIAVAPRTGTAIGPGADAVLAMEPVDASSTEVRRRVQAGEGIADLVTPEVEELIRTEGLYRASA